MPPKATDAPQKRLRRGTKTAPMEVDPVDVPALDPKPKASRAPRGKRVHGSNDVEVENEPVAPKKRKVMTATKPSQELDTVKAVEAPPTPRHATQDTNMGGIKKKRRTRQEIAAAKEEAERAKEEAEKDKARLSKLAQEADKRLLQMDVDDENTRVEQAEKAIRRLSDLENEDSRSGGEEFVGYDAVSLSSDEESDSGEGPEDSLEKKTYEELHGEIAALKRKLLEGKRRNGGGKKKMDTHASGLLPDWNKTPEPTRATEKKRSYIAVTAGGLEDSDADAVNPFTDNDAAPTSRKPQTQPDTFVRRDLSRRNELVKEIGTSQGETQKVQPRNGKKSTAAARIPVPLKGKTAERKQKAPQNDPAAVETKHHFKPGNIRISDLPDFAVENSKWRKVFLPTLYDRFFASDEPFLKFIKGGQPFIKFLQVTVGLVYPGITYKVTSTDAIHLLAYNRINEKRSSIGSSAITLVKSHIGSLDGENARHDWLRWALRMDGPLFFENPTPYHSTSDRANPAYIHPRGRLISKFIIQLAKPFLNLKAGSVAEYNHPRGLFALVMTSLERAVRAQLQPDNIQEFSNDYWGSKVTSYYSSLAAVDDRRWREVFDACGVAGSASGEQDETQADLSLLDCNRAVLFDFSSPHKT